MDARRSTAPARARRWIAFAALAATTAIAGSAVAHQVGLSRGDYAFAGDELTAEIIFARGELGSVVTDLDANGDGRLDPDEVERARPQLEAAIIARMTVTANGKPCPGKLVAAKLAEEDGLTLRGSFRCAGAAPSAHVDLGFLEDLAHGHRHVARARGPSGEREDVLYRGNSGLDVPAGAAPISPSPNARTTAASAAPATSAPSFIVLGFSRFLREYLHAAFLVAALLVVASRRARLEVGGAFVIGSIAGLALAVLGVWSPDPRAVAPAMAISAAYAGLTGLFVADGRATRATALAFGVVHGFGLAAAIGASPAALAPFAAGVALAEVLVVALLVAVADWAHRTEPTRRLVSRVGCAASAVAGLAGAAIALAR